MDCDFINSLTTEQKTELRKLLDEDEKPKPKYQVKVKFHDAEKTKIKSLVEYMGNNLHGVRKSWYESGQLEYEWPRQNNKPHGICKAWYENGQLEYENYYLHGKEVTQEEYHKAIKETK